MTSLKTIHLFTFNQEDTMKKLTFIAAIGAALISLSSAHAADGASPNVIAKVEVTGSQRYQLAPQEFDTFKGRYEFDQGTAMRVWQQQNRFYAQIADQPVQQMFGKAPGLFESTNGATLRFAEDGSTVAVTHFGKLLVAANTVRFAKN
jgi:opacity protein-like surface antigen